MPYGPETKLAQELHQMKYRAKGESFVEAQNRFAAALADDEPHFRAIRDILLNQRFMGGGRTQLAVGSPNQVKAFNCYVSGAIQDSIDSIADRAKEAVQTMRKGGGIGYDFSTIRPKGQLISTLNSAASGPVSFMRVFDSWCKAVSSAGQRRGAQMGVLRVDHPDIEEFVHAKQNRTELTAFNVSVAVTDEFMRAVQSDSMFDLVFEGKRHKQVHAPTLWEMIMRSTHDWAEPGVLFIDRINTANNLYYCEEIAATNPCGEQPLPPFGACLLGSFNLVKYVDRDNSRFDMPRLLADIPHVVRAMDNIHDNTVFPLPEQARESEAKRRMGLGVTGLANAIETLGHPYGSADFLTAAKGVLKGLRNGVYRASVELAKEKGPFPLFDADSYLAAEFIQTLPDDIRDGVRKHGVRNSHLLSFAPTGTISLTADNVSGGIEPVFSLEYDRQVITDAGPVVEVVQDYAYREWGVEGRIANDCTPDDHLAVLALATKYSDSAVSKTINVSPDLPWQDFKGIYMKAWKLGCKGCTTFNSGGKRYGVLGSSIDKGDEAKACYLDPVTGQKECS
jgi:ribonucleoside-diphosphate reductase alpha chain